MTDIVEQTARVLYEHYSRSDGLDVTAQESAQALADAGLLREPVTTILEEFVVPCAKCNPDEGRCMPCRKEAGAYYRAAINAINPNLAAKELARDGDSDAGGYVGRDLRELAERIKQHLLQQPARTVPTRDVYELAIERITAESTWTVDAREALGLTRTESSRIFTDVQDLEMSLDRVVIRDADGDIYERQGELETERGTYAAWLGTHNGIKPSPDIRLPATVIYVPGEIVGDRPTRQEVWQEAFSAGYMDGQSHTVPTRGEIADAVMARDEIDVDYLDRDSALRYADAVLALLAGQPTGAEVKAAALEEFAEIWATGEWSDWFLAENVTCDVSAVQATDKALRERAQQIRDGK